MQNSTPSAPDNPSLAPSEFSWTICPGCTQRQESQDATPCSVCGRVNPIRQIRHQSNEWTAFRDWMLRPLGWCIQIWTLCFILPSLHAVCVGTMPLTLYFTSILAQFFGMALLPVWFGRLLFRAGYLFVDIQHRYRRPGWRGYALLPLGVAVTLIAQSTLIGPKIGFWLARPTLEAILKNPPKTDGPTHLRAGPYSILHIERTNGEVRLEVSRGGGDFGKLITHAGFAYRLHPPRNQEPIFDEDPSYVQIAPDWYWYENAERYYPPLMPMNPQNQ